MSAANSTPQAGVMGWPVTHSKSPLVHGYWLNHYGIEGSYVRLPVEPTGLAEALRSLADKGFVGVNLTVPHKEAALDLVDEVSHEARRIGAANTIFVSDEGRLCAENTDAYGFITNLQASQPALDLTSGPAVVLGAGGASRAICVALQDAGVPEVRLVNRTLSRAQNLAAILGGNIRIAPWDQRSAQLNDSVLLVNTTVLGMAGQPPLEIDIATLAQDGVVTDIVYSPLETPLLAAARTRGNRTVDGLGMLLYQAQAGFEGWFGRKPEVTPALRDYVLSAV
jgi:shikimate dehydrogenase